MTSTVLLVVAKSPEPGLAKTRLTPVVSEQVAAEIAAASLLDTLAAVYVVSDVAACVAWTGALDRAVRSTEVADALARVTVVPQRGEGLGARLAGAHADVAEAFPGTPVLQIGMDTPQVTSSLLAGAVAPLHRPGGPDAVLGPAADGGWWALGLRDPCAAELVRTVPMSRGDTGALTLRALRSADLRVEALPELVDVDTMDDAELVAAEIPFSRFAGAVHATVGDAP